MLHVVKSVYDASHPLGVITVKCVSDLIAIIKSHRKETGERYCRLFASLPGGLRLDRWVALSTNERTLLAKTELSPAPLEIRVEDIDACPYLGRFLHSGRLFYDPLEMEMPANAGVMQRLS